MAEKKQRKVYALAEGDDLVLYSDDTYGSVEDAAESAGPDDQDILDQGEDVYVVQLVPIAKLKASTKVEADYL